MKRRSRRRYRAIRRVPQAYPGLYLRLKVAPVLPALAATVAVGSLAEIPALPKTIRARARAASDDMGTSISEKPSASSSIPLAWTRSSSAPSRTSHGAPRASDACGHARSLRSVLTRTGAWLACCPSSPGADTTPS